MAGGRPTKYKESFDHMAEVACGDGGFTNVQLAKLFSTTVTSITTWKQKYPEFLAAIKRGKDRWDTEKVEASLLKRAMGYKYTETTQAPVHIKGPGGDVISTELVTSKKVLKSIAPDVTAQIFWLKNRQPARWRDKQNIEHSGDVTFIRPPIINKPDGCGT